MVVEQPSLVSLAATSIRQLIVTGELAPGSRLHEPPLATELGISRPPLREALRILESEGLLTKTPRRGYRVIQLSAQDIDEIYSLRNALELFAVELILRRRTNDMFAPLDKVILSMREAAAANDRVAVVQANVDFHVELVALAQHARLLSAYRGVMVQMQLLMAANLTTEAEVSGDLERGCVRHEQLLERLKTGDRDQIVRDFAQHGERTYLSLRVDEEIGV